MRSLRKYVFFIFCIYSFLNLALTAEPLLPSNDNRLKGKTLRCFTLQERPIVFKDSRIDSDGSRKTVYEGLAFEYLEFLQEKLGFACRSNDTNSNFEEYTKGFNQFIDFLYDRRSTCDDCIAIAGFRQSSERYGKVDFLPPFTYSQYQVATRPEKQKPKSGFSAFILGFPSNVWLAILGLVAILGMLRLVEAGDFLELPTEEIEVSGIRGSLHTFGRSKWTLYPWLAWTAVVDMILTHRGHNRTKSFGGWLISVLAVLIGIFLLFIYEGAMTANLLTEELESRFRTTADIMKCEKHMDLSKFCVPDGRAVSTFWKAVVQNQSCPAKSKNVDISNTFQESNEGVFEALNRSECEFSLSERYTASSFINGRYCGDVVETGDGFADAGLSFVLPLGSQYTSELNIATLEINEEGNVPSLDEYIARTGLCNVRKVPAISFERLSLFFQIALICGVVMVIFLIIEWYYRRT